MSSDAKDPSAAHGNRHDLLQRVCATVHGFMQAGNEVFAAEGATFVRNRTCPRRYDANHITDVHTDTPDAIERLLARADREFAGFGHRRFDLDPFTPPPFVARLALEGYGCGETVQLLLQGELRALVRPAVIRRVENDRDWDAYAALQHEEWKEATAKQERIFKADVAVEFVVAKRAKCPPVSHWIAEADGTPCGYISSWPGNNGVGIVEDLFTLPQFRHRGIATALIAHTVDDVRRSGANAVVIGALTDDTPKHMYAAMGFRPVLVTRNYLQQRRHI